MASPRIQKANPFDNRLPWERSDRPAKKQRGKFKPRNRRGGGRK